MALAKTDGGRPPERSKRSSRHVVPTNLAERAGRRPARRTGRVLAEGRSRYNFMRNASEDDSPRRLR
jgi:hypothetical protein